MVIPQLQLSVFIPIQRESGKQTLMELNQLHDTGEFTGLSSQLTNGVVSYKVGKVFEEFLLHSPEIEKSEEFVVVEIEFTFNGYYDEGEIVFCSPADTIPSTIPTGIHIKLHYETTTDDGNINMDEVVDDETYKAMQEAVRSQFADFIRESTEIVENC